MADHPPCTLELALGSKSKIAVLRLLFDSPRGFSGAALARHAGTGLFAIQRTLIALEGMGLVEVERGNRENRYKLNGGHYLVCNGLKGLFEGEQQMPQALARELGKLLRGKVLSAGVFGSFARGGIRSGSDIDLFVIVKSARDKKIVSEILADAHTRLATRYGWPVQAVIFEARQLKERRSRIGTLLGQAIDDWHHVTGMPPLKTIEAL